MHAPMIAASPEPPRPHRYSLRPRTPPTHIGPFRIPAGGGPVPPDRTPSRPVRKGKRVAGRVDDDVVVPVRFPLDSVQAPATPVTRVVQLLASGSRRLAPATRAAFTAMLALERHVLADVDWRWPAATDRRRKRVTFSLLSCANPPTYGLLGTQAAFEDLVPLLVAARSAVRAMDDGGDLEWIMRCCASRALRDPHERHALRLLADAGAAIDNALTAALSSLIRFYVKSVFNARDFDRVDLTVLHHCAALNL